MGVEEPKGGYSKISGELKKEGGCNGQMKGAERPMPPEYIRMLTRGH